MTSDISSHDHQIRPCDITTQSLHLVWLHVGYTELFGTKESRRKSCKPFILLSLTGAPHGLPFRLSPKRLSDFYGYVSRHYSKFDQNYPFFNWRFVQKLSRISDIATWTTPFIFKCPGSSFLLHCSISSVWIRPCFWACCAHPVEQWITKLAACFCHQFDLFLKFTAALATFSYPSDFKSLYIWKALSGVISSCTTLDTALIIAMGASDWKILRPISTPAAP